MSAAEGTSHDLVGFWARLKRAGLTLGLPIAVATILPIVLTIVAALANEAWTLFVAIVAALAGWGAAWYSFRPALRAESAVAESAQHAQLTPIMLSFHKHDTAELEQTVAMIRAALLDRTFARASFAHTTLLLELGRTLFDLGERTGNAEHLVEATRVLRAALADNADGFFPLQRAELTTYLGRILQSLGHRSHAVEPIEEAVRMYRTALSKFDYERAPREFAVILNNLGTAQWELSQLQGDRSLLMEALESYSATERVRGRAPLERAIAQLNLGIVLWRSTEFARDGGFRRAGLEALDQAIKFFEENIQTEIVAGYCLILAMQVRSAMIRSPREKVERDN
jgi:tetratricopeptide (TPR) repeat protein